MNKKVMRCGILSLTMAVGSAVYGTVSISSKAWYDATIDGYTYVNGSHNLPTGWDSFTSSGYLWAKMEIECSRKGNSSPTDLTLATSGSMRLGYYINSTDPAPPASYTLNITRTYTLSDLALADRVGASAIAAAATSSYTLPVAKDYGASVGVGWTSTKIVKRVHPIYFSGTTGNYTAVVISSLETMASKVITHTGGGGSYLVAYARGTITSKDQAYLNNLGYARGSGSINAATPITVEAFLSGVSQGEYEGDTSSGTFTADFDLANGTYDLKFWAPGSLRKIKSGVSLVLGSTTSCGTVALKFGDLNGDNYVSQDEADFIGDHIGTALTAPDIAYNPNDDYFLAYADFDRDGEITSADWIEACANVGITGD